MKEKIRSLQGFKRVLCILLSVSLFVFVLYNIFWIAYVKHRFDPFTENIPKKNDSIILSENGISYSVAEPHYLHLNGNLSVVNESTHEGIIIWPNFPYGYTYAAVLITDVNNQQGKDIPHISIMQIDENGMWADDSGVFGEKEKTIVRERQADIQTLIRLANEMWDLKNETQ